MAKDAEAEGFRIAIMFHEIAMSKEHECATRPF
jgi:hypothetical protein